MPSSSSSSSSPKGIALRRHRLRFLFPSKQEVGFKGKTDSVQWWRRAFSLPSSKSRSKSEAELAGRENDYGGDDADHLVVMVNGLSGGPEDWRYAAEQWLDRFPGRVFVHRSVSNTSWLTHDGIDIMGERLAEEIRSLVKERRSLRKISFVAHSAGGLISRYAIGKLFETVQEMESSHSDQEQKSEVLQGRIAGLEPVNFITSGTPHLGSRWRKQVPILCGIPFLESTAVRTAHLLVGRTGNHLYLTDSQDGKPPLLLRMVADCEDGNFISALRSFKRRAAYANCSYDFIVGWETSSIRRQHELPEVPKLPRHSHDKKYPHIVYVDKGNVEIQANGRFRRSDPTDNPEAEDLTDDEMKRETMIRGLTQVTWERVDVCFHKSWLAYNAHNNIQVRRLVNSDGKDVICHMIDNFHL